MINFRILGMVGFYSAIAGLSVMTVRLAVRPAVWEEHIPYAALPTAERVSNGLEIAVRGQSVEVRVPGCSAAAYPDIFFVHVYPRRTEDAPDGDYINMGFLLAQETPERQVRDGVPVCNYKRSFARLDAAEVLVGQYRMNGDGTCCQILWSRSYSPSTQ